MSARLPLPRVWILTAMMCAFLVAPLVFQGGTASASGPSIAVIGDSISARYNDDPGSARQAWWSVVGRHYEAPVTIFAESGSGYVRPGGLCDGTRFGDRLADVVESDPQVVIVEGGRNDWAYCNDLEITQASNASLKASVDRFLTELQRSLDPRTTIYVLGPPWGTVNASEQSRVTSIIESSARRHYMRFIDTQGVFDGARTIDGTHPNRAGSLALGDRVVEGIGSQLPSS
ncbi:SGNH/GDSL hydrolase family protein [Aeromicrobium sp.]